MNNENTITGVQPFGLGSRVKFITRNVFFEGQVIDIKKPFEGGRVVAPYFDTAGTKIGEVTVDQLPIQSLPESYREPMLIIAVVGYEQPFRIFRDNCVRAA